MIVTSDKEWIAVLKERKCSLRDPVLRDGTRGGLNYYSDIDGEPVFYHAPEAAAKGVPGASAEPINYQA